MRPMSTDNSHLPDDELEPGTSAPDDDMDDDDEIDEDDTPMESPRG